MMDVDNLRRAWRWLKSNPDSTYKHYCRDLYRTFAIAEDALLEDLADRLKRGIYTPSHASKLYFPKSSGILRPYSILTVEDQIVYQAAVNVVAEKLFPRVRHRYFEEVFGHLYAGRTSIWFYRRWTDGYKAFNKSARKAFKGGFKFTASFDLTACYDSLDHGVLKHSLREIGCDKEFNERLTEWLSIWTATTRDVYMSHGIPQGPLSSGLLSEVVLREFDERRRAEGKVKYFRYVDDIRLFAKKEEHLRSMLVKLDMMSKDIGLFPQSSKIDIHEVTDIEKEIKAVSNPSESAIRGKVVDQAKLRKRLTALTPRFRIKNSTRFKYLLAHAKPNAALTARLWRVLEHHPESYATFCRYLARYSTMPAKTGERLVKQVKENGLYPAIRACFIEVATDRLRSTEAKKLDPIVKPFCKPASIHGELAAVAGRWCIKRGLLTSSQIEYACRKSEPWWARARLLAAIEPATTSGTTMRAVLNTGLRDKTNDVAIAAALQAALHGVDADKPRRTIHRSAALLLKDLGLIERSTPICGIHASLEVMLGTVPTVNWRKLFKRNYRKAEKHIVICRGYVGTDISAWVNGMDVFNDWLLNALFVAEPSLGSYSLGAIGSVLAAPTGRLAKGFPGLFALAKDIHDRRLESHLSHPKTKSTGKPTRPIPFKYVFKGKKLLRTAVEELAAKL